DVVGGAPRDRLDDLRQQVDRAETVIELAAAVVRNVDPLDAVLDRALRVLARGDALERQWNVELLLHALDHAPVERRLELAAGDAAAPGSDEALGAIALAPAADRGIDGGA